MKILFERIKAAYWACDKCMQEAGGTFPEDHVCTKILSKCSVCNSDKKEFLTPWVDYNWKNIRTEHLRD